MKHPSGPKAEASAEGRSFFSFCFCFGGRSFLAEGWAEGFMFSKMKYEAFFNSVKAISQCLKIDFNRISNSINKNYMGLTSMLQGFQKCIA